MNRVLGVVPPQRELSGLRLRRPRIPRRAMRLLIGLAYRWQPSAEFERRQVEMRRASVWAAGLRKLRLLPPVLGFREDTDIAPQRFQQLLDVPPGSIEDLSDIEREEQLRTVWTIRPRPPEIDPEYLLSHRPLLPRRYRTFLRYSPYPRIIVGLTLAVTAVTAAIWLTQLQQAEAVAAGRLHSARSTLRVALDDARAYGVDHRRLEPLERQARTLQRISPPPGIVVSRSRLQWYRRQTGVYARLVRLAHRLDRQAMRYWTWREGMTYADLVMAHQALADLDLHLPLPPIPACGTPRCFRGAVAEGQRQVAALNRTARALRSYARSIAAAPDPAAASAAETQKAHAMATVTSTAGLPVPPATLDALSAAAGSTAQYARAGALARLDADVLRRTLLRGLAGRAVVVDLEDQTLYGVDRGRVALTSPIAAGSATPTGRFHVLVRQAAVPATYWHRLGSSYRYVPGILPDWMSFSGAIALQGAPWRTAFGPGSAGAIGAYAPDTAGSVDLPPAFAAFLFRWATVGTDVVVY